MKDVFFRTQTARCLGLALTLVLLSGCATSGRAEVPPQGDVRAKLQIVLDRWRERDDVAGATMAVELPGYVSWEGASGWSDAKGSSSMVPGARFAIASVTKTFVATVVLQLAEERKLSLDDPVSMYVSDAPHAEDVRIEHLLRHMSGIPESQDALWAEKAIERPDRPWTRDQLLSAAAEKPRQFEPGSRFGYSNTNYLLLGDVIRAVTGNDWRHEVHERVIKPLQLRNTFASEGMTAPEVVTGYVDHDGDGATDDPFNGPWIAFNDPAGGMISSASDLTRFARALFEGNLLSGRSRQKLLTPGYFTSSMGYGLGVQFARPDLVTLMVGHTGGMPGFSAALLYVPEHSLAVSALVNNGSSSASDLAELAIRTTLDAMLAPAKAVD